MPSISFCEARGSLTMTCLSWSSGLAAKRNQAPAKSSRVVLPGLDFGFGRLKEFREHRPDLRIRLYDAGQGAVARRIEAGKLDFGLCIFKRMPGVRRVPCFRYSLMVIRPDKNAAFNRVSTRWSAINGQTLISLTTNYPTSSLSTSNWPSRA